MKKILLLSFVIALNLTSCSISNEKKAEKLIKEVLNGYLYHPETYEPISTRVDSMFIEASTIEPIMEISKKTADLTRKISICKIQLKSAESSMDIWAPNGYSSQFSRGEYARAKQEKEEIISNLEKYNEKLFEQINALKDNVSKYKKGEFTGWAVTHRFKSLNGNGSVSIPAEMIFFCDEEFTSCSGYETEKLDKFSEILEMMNEAKTDDDIIDYFKDNWNTFNSIF